MFTATARSQGGALLQRVDVNGRHEITTDEPTSLGGTDSAPAPHELLPAMLAACVGVTLATYAQKHDWNLDELSVEVTYDNQVTPRRVTTTLHLPDGLTPDQISRLERVAEACPVKRALEAGFSFDPAVVSRPENTAATEHLRTPANTGRESPVSTGYFGGVRASA